MPDQKPKRGTRADLKVRLNHALEMNSYLTSRMAIGRGLGQQFGGERELYEVFGYTKTPAYDNYLNIYEREGLGTRIADAPPEETWRLHPILVEGDNKTIDELDDPSPMQKDFSALADEHDIWSQIREADVSLAMSKFSILFLGMPGKPEDEVKKSGKLFYVTSHDEGDAIVDESTISTDPEDPRFGLPERYNITIDAKKNKQVPVHYSRVIHIKEGKDRRSFPRIYGLPRFQSILNRLFDMEKVIGAGSEAFWLLIRKGMALSAKEGMTLPQTGTPEYEALQDEVDEYEHGLRRVMRLVGMDVTELGSQPVDAGGQFNVIVSYIAGATHIPQRILLGSERGELASSQDEYNFSKYIKSRQLNFAEPYILRPLIKRLGELGLMKVPEVYTVHWQDLFQLTDLEQADLATKVAGAISTVSGGAPETVMLPRVFAKRYLDYVPTKEEEKEMQDEKDEAAEQTEFPPQGETDEPVDVRELLGKFPGTKKLDKATLNYLINALEQHHYGPGPHETGSPQRAHGGDRSRAGKRILVEPYGKDLHNMPGPLRRKVEQQLLDEFTASIVDGDPLAASRRSIASGAIGDEAYHDVVFTELRVEGKLVGVMSTKEDRNKYLYIGWVASAVDGQGYGKSMLVSAIKDAASRDLGVRGEAANGAIPYYQALGAEVMDDGIIRISPEKVKEAAKLFANLNVKSNKKSILDEVEWNHGLLMDASQAPLEPETEDEEPA